MTAGGYWFETGDGSLAGVGSNPLEILPVGNYDVVLSNNEGARELQATIVTVLAPASGD